MAIPGLPALAGNVIVDAVQLITADALSIFGALGGPQWGLFLNGDPVVVADNVVSFEFKQDMRISNFPVEEGSFATYNKAQVPYDVRLQFSTGGSVSDRQALTDSVDAVITSTDLFDAVTPEKVYQSINPIHQSLRRTSRNGVGLLVIDVYCEEVRVTATQQFANSSQQQGGATTTVMTIRQPQSPSAAPQVSDGTVQPVAPTAAQSAAFTDARGTGFDF
jgi:hypothetical protein